MSDGPNVQLTVVSEDQYRENQARIEQAQAALDKFKAMNDAAKQAYEKQQQLLRKIQEGREAERQLLELENASGSAQLAIAGPSSQQMPPAANYNPGWQQYHTSQAMPSKPQNHPGTGNGYREPYVGSSSAQSGFFGQPIPQMQSSSNTRVSQDYPGIPGQQQTQYYQPAPQAVKPTRQEYHYVPYPEPPRPRPGGVSQTNQRIGRTTAGTAGQGTSVVNQKRQPLPMQPVMQQTLQSNQFQAAAHSVHPQPQKSVRGAASRTDYGHAQYSSHATSVPSAIPNIVDPPRSLHSQPPPTPGFSSLAGALDLPKQRITTGSGLVSSTPKAKLRPPPSSLSVMAAKLQEQIAMSKTSSTSSTAPDSASTTVANASAGFSTASSSNTQAHIPPPLSSTTPTKAEDSVAFIRKLTSNTELMQRLQQLADKLTIDTQPKTYFTLPNSAVQIYKDEDSKLYVIFPDTSKATGLSFIPLSTLKEISQAKQTQEPSATPAEPVKTTPPEPVAPTHPAPSGHVYTDNQGNFEGPLTSEMSNRFNPYVQLQSQPPKEPDFEAFIHYAASSAPSATNGPQAAPALTAATDPPAAIPLPSNFPAPSTPASGRAPVPTTSSPVTNPVTSRSASVGSTIRTPAEADRKSLAKDLLRALSFSSRKRPQPEASLAHPLEPPTKRHASELDTHPLSLAYNESRAADGIELPPRSGAVIAPVISSAVVQTPGPLGNHERLRLEQTMHRIPPGNYDRERPKPLMPPEGSSSMQVRTSVSPQRKPMLLSPPKQSPSHPPRPQTAAEEVHVVLSPRTTPQSPPAPTAQDESVITPYESNRSPSWAPPTAATVSPSLKRRAKTPLFLPSPSSSPLIRPTSGAAEDISIDLTLDHAPSTSRKDQPFYILVPPPPPYLVKYKTQQLRKRQSLLSPIEVDDDEAEVEEVRSSASTVDDEDIEIIDTDPASNGFVNDEAELEAVRLSCSRISERSCKWNGCDVVMASAERLIQHFASAHSRKRTFKGLYVCLWQQCGRHENNSAQLFHHLKGHATIPLLCAYNDCQQLFRTPRQLAKHHQTEHNNARLKPSAALFSPELEPPPEIPGIVPSYLIKATVPQASMSKERHAVLGPWVLQNIAGPVNLGIRRYNAASKLTRTSSSEGVRRNANQPYDFLNYPSTNFSTAPSQPSRIRNMVDLESGEVSELVQDGMVLWAPPSEDDSEPKAEETDEIDEQFFSPVPDQEIEEIEEVDEIFAVEYSRDLEDTT